MKETIYTQETLCLDIRAAILEMDVKRAEPETDPLVLYSQVIGRIEAIVQNAMSQISPDEIATDCPY